jgi:hypothetical protein
MTRLQDAFDSARDVLNVQPIVSELVLRQIREGRNMSAPKHHYRVASRDGMAFEKRFADATAVKRSAGQIGTKGTSSTLLPRFPVLWPGSCHATALHMKSTQSADAMTKAGQDATCDTLPPEAPLITAVRV